MSTRSALLLVAAVAALAVHGTPAQAQAPRTWVSQTGDDANPCSLLAPCRTFVGAISKTAAGGQIDALNSADYGTVTVTRPISIEAVGVIAGAASVTIRAGANDVVHLKGLIMDGAGAAAAGIRIVSGGAVLISGCVIQNYGGSPGLGIEIAPTATTKVFVSDCAIAANSVGISVKPNGGAAQVFLDRVKVYGNSGTAVLADGQSAVVRLNASTISGNATGLAAADGGSILSFGNNAVAGNASDGSPTGAVPLK